ncbi:related to high-affinity iron permease [Rhynchosporium agropyri]|uniref:Related to high-affinity iron permease n=1 Tax=Rhynchosporium agropyri TaxID=914238 RepID=A0A1E1LAT6_9HELO|nr:related to high-affinity iron permease [Rhynchosporium agropyri]
MTVNVFAVPVFFIVFRETLETAIIVSVLLAFLKQTLDGPSRDVAVYKKLVKQVWYGTGAGLLICLIIGAGLIGAFYGAGKNAWAKSEYYWEGSFGIVASVVITIMGAALLRVAKMQEKWRVKLAKAMEDKAVTTEGKGGAWKRWAEKYAMFILPFITVLREGLEAVVFIAGVSFSAPARAVPLPVVMGLLAGGVVGYLIYKGGATSKLQVFLIVSTCFLYLVAAGLFSKAVWFFQAQKWNDAVGGDAAEVGAGPGSYDIDQSVWHVNYGNPELNGGGGWGIFNAILGWQNSATYGSVISYNVYWIVVITGFLLMRYRETKGHLPFQKAKLDAGPGKQVRAGSASDGSSSIVHSADEKEAGKTVQATTTTASA